MTLGKYEPTIRADGTKDFSVPGPEAYGDCALKWEWDYLKEQHGYYALEKEGDFWYATR